MFPEYIDNFLEKWRQLEHTIMNHEKTKANFIISEGDGKMLSRFSVNTLICSPEINPKYFSSLVSHFLVWSHCLK